MAKLLRFTFLTGTIFFCFFSSQAQSLMRITEYMYDGADQEFVEFTNVGSTPIDMTGWQYSDNGRLDVGSKPLPLGGFGTVQPGESVIFCQSAAADFRTAWGLCSGIKIVGGSTTNLGRADEINLYDASNNLIDRLTYDDQHIAGTIRTSGASGYVSAAGLGANNPAAWTLSAAGDPEGSFASAGGDIGSPGKSTRATVAYDPCATVPGAPAIAINVAATSNFLDGGVSVSPVGSFDVSGVKGDAGDPASTLGIDFTIGDDATAVGSLTVSVVSSNLTVVPAANLQLTGTGADRNLKITPAAAGYSNIRVTVNDGTNNTTFVINYAASVNPAVTPVAYWPTGIADASAAIALDDDYMIIANDESNLLYVYDRKKSGLPVKTFDFNQANLLGLTDGSPGNWKELDLEAAVSSKLTPGRIYWLGSMSNSSSFNLKPNRDRLFAVTVTGTGAATSFVNEKTGSGTNYKTLRQELITWGDANGYDFTDAAADGKDPKTIDGFNIEGMVFGPDDRTMYIGFRAPLVGVNTKAVIAPIQDFENWFNDPLAGNVTIGAPIELDLGGRGIRDMIRLSNNNYVIIAGSYGGAALGAIFKWTGNPADAPMQISSMDITSLNVEAVLPINAAGVLLEDRLQVISDDGDNAFYGDGVAAKDLGPANFKKFSSNIMVAAVGSPLPITFTSFTANKVDKSVVLNWNAQLEGVEKFEVLRSVNGTDFTVVGSVPASASQTMYSFTDNTVGNSGKVYYRIRAVEYGDAATVTTIRFVDFDNLAPMITLYPNPVVNNRFSIMVNKPGVKTLTVWGSNGGLFRQSTFNEQVTDISTAGWAKGWYLINIRTIDGATATYKVIVP